MQGVPGLKAFAKYLGNLVNKGERSTLKRTNRCYRVTFLAVEGEGVVVSIVIDLVPTPATIDGRIGVAIVGV